MSKELTEPMADLYKFENDLIARLSLPKYEKPSANRLIIIYNGFTYDKRLSAFYAARANMGVDVTEMYFGNVYTPTQVKEIKEGSSKIMAYTCMKVEKVTEVMKKVCKAGDLVNIIIVSFTTFTAGSEALYKKDIEELKERGEKENIKFNVKIITPPQMAFNQSYEGFLKLKNVESKNFYQSGAFMVENTEDLFYEEKTKFATEFFKAVDESKSIEVGAGKEGLKYYPFDKEGNSIKCREGNNLFWINATKGISSLSYEEPTTKKKKEIPLKPNEAKQINFNNYQLVFDSVIDFAIHNIKSEHGEIHKKIIQYVIDMETKLYAEAKKDFKKSGLFDKLPNNIHNDKLEKQFMDIVERYKDVILYGSKYKDFVERNDIKSAKEAFEKIEQFHSILMYFHSAKDSLKFDNYVTLPKRKWDNSNILDRFVYGIIFGKQMFKEVSPEVIMRFIDFPGVIVAAEGKEMELNLVDIYSKKTVYFSEYKEKYGNREDLKFFPVIRDYNLCTFLPIGNVIIYGPLVKYLFI
ncbi:MAG: hypothetical protein MJ252_21690 [archaeon]|nr:hypothetical protein [archaeon]